VKKDEDIPDTDKKLWEEYLKNPKDLFDKELESKKLSNRAERFRFDLHGFTLVEENKYKEILLITGKGLHSNTDQNTYVSKELSKLKFAVPEYIRSQKELSEKINEIEQASIKDGGEGAIIIKLKQL